MASHQENIDELSFIMYYILSLRPVFFYLWQIVE